MEASEGRETERMAESAVQSAAETLTYFLRQKDFYLSHVDVWVRTLRNKLKALLKDVDGMRGYNESVQLIEVANNTKNVIDSFIFKIAQQRGETSAGLMSYQSTFNSGIKDKPAIEGLGKKIFDLKTRLDEIILPILPILPNRSQYGVHNIQGRGEASTSSNQSQIHRENRAPNLKRRLDEIILPNRSQYGIHNIQPSGEASTSSNQNQIQREKRAPIVEETEVVGFEDETRTLVGRLITGDMQHVEEGYFLNIEASEGRETERMAKSAIQSAAETLIYFLQQKDFYLSHVDVSVMSLKNKFKALLKDVDGMRGYNESVQLIEVANNTKNVIDSFIFKIAQQRGETSAGLMSYQSTFNSGIKDKPAIEDLGKKIFHLKTRLEEIILSNRSQYGIHNIQASGEASTSSNQSQIQREKRAPIVNEAEVIGFEDETRKLVERLIAGDMQRVVISITGPGGIGKTTLAKKVYDNIQVRKSFYFRYWVDVHQQYPEPEKDSTIYWGNKRSLVVIDGIWSREAWDGLVTAFPDFKNGSRVLLTTRNEEVAKYADAQSTPHKLRFLNENESWTLFCKKALLGNPSSACLPNLEELGRRMVAKCGRLPLAITVLGDVLSRKEKSVSEWEEMHRSVERWLHQSQEDAISVVLALSWKKSVEWLHQSQEDAISVIFALSYHDMPNYLKPCFLYFGAFPDNSKIFVDELIRIWIAEGFVQRRGEKEMEDVAEDYVEELISRSMIQVSQRKSNGMAKKCGIHDLLRDLAISKAEKERFLYVYGNKVPTSSITADRLAITSGDISNRISLKSCTLPLLSLLDFSYESYLTEKLALKILGRAFEFLRVMHLQSKKVYYLPVENGDLIHLRYLRLEIELLALLPSTITRLSNLQTLDIRHISSKFEWLADDIVKMEQIRHFIVYNIRFSNGMQLHHLSNLRTLKRVRAGSWIEYGLEKLTNLRDLEIHEIGGDVHMALSRSISKLVHLRSLLLWAHYASWIPAFESFSKHEHLYKMKLYGRLEKLPEPHVFPPNLTGLRLERSELERDPMVTLEKLPNLRSLCMDNRSILGYLYMGKEMVCSAGGFPLLDTLTINGFNELEEWRVEEGAMRNLRCLEISLCGRLKMLPDGLQHVTTLRELNLVNMPVAFKERVRKNEGEDWFKIQHIPSLIISKLWS